MYVFKDFQGLENLEKIQALSRTSISPNYNFLKSLTALIMKSCRTNSVMFVFTVLHRLSIRMLYADDARQQPPITVIQHTHMCHAIDQRSADQLLFHEYVTVDSVNYV